MMIVDSSFENSYCVSEQANKMLTVDIWGRQGGWRVKGYTFFNIWQILEQVVY